MNRSRYALAVLLMFAMTAWAAPAEDEAKKQVRAVLDAQVAAWNKGDLDRFLEGYWDDPGLTFFAGGNVSKGLKAVRERYQKRYKAEGKEMGKLSFSEMEVFILGEKEALVRARWQLEMKKDKPGGLFTLWMRKLPGGWKVVHDHTSAAEKKE
jgi:uncharacterized protein (TIGR02246 family)